MLWRNKRRCEWRPQKKKKRWHQTTINKVWCFPTTAPSRISHSHTHTARSSSFDWPIEIWQDLLMARHVFLCRTVFCSFWADRDFAISSFIATYFGIGLNNTVSNSVDRRILHSRGIITREKTTRHAATTMLIFSTIIFISTSAWIVPVVFAVTSSNWGSIRYFSSNGCQPASLLYIETFPLNVCYKTGMEKYYKMNTVSKSGVAGCPSCWHYVRQQYSDVNCINPSTSPYSMVYRDTSTSCGLITGATNIYARYIHPPLFVPLPPLNIHHPTTTYKSLSNNFINSNHIINRNQCQPSWL